MSQRTRAGMLALGLTAVLWAAAVFFPLPYVTYYPGPTVDILGQQDGVENIRVEGHRSYHHDGELRLTTVYVSQPQDDVSLPELLKAYFDPVAAVWPRSAVYAPEETDASNGREGAVAMVSSQDTAVAAALTELGTKLSTVVEVLDVAEGLPADGHLKVRDVLIRVGDTDITEAQDVIDAVEKAPLGTALPIVVRRDGRLVTVSVKPRKVEGHKRIGISPGVGYDFPFDVTVNIGEGIGGPSAGLMMSLAVYDTLTPRSLTNGHIVAGTGTITEAGEVGPIGGIQQKIAAARDSGAALFLVPADNCDGIGGLDPGGMRLAKVSSMHQAVGLVEDWSADVTTTLPTCKDTTS